MGVKISNLPAIVTPALTDVFPVVQSGTTYKETLSQLKTLLTTSGGLIYNSVAGTTQTLSAGNAYIFNNVAATTGSLPASGSSTIGDTIKIKGRSAAPWIIQANTGQTIKFGSSASSVAGTATSALGSDSIQFVYVAANEWSVDWAVSSSITLA